MGKITDYIGSLFNPPPTLPPPPAEVKREFPPTSKLAALSGFGEQINLSQTADIETINAALRQSERGNPWQLNTFYRDFVLGSAHVQSVWGVRKMAVVAQPHKVAPFIKSAQDEKAADAIKEMIDLCENWHDGLISLLDATLYPNAICEKLFRVPEGNETIKVRYGFRRFEPVNPLLIWYGAPFMAGTSLSGTNPESINLPSLPQAGDGEGMIYNANDWESDIRLYQVMPNGFIDKSPAHAYRLYKLRHIVHRGGTLNTAIRDCYGGHMRSVLIWLFFLVIGRDGFAKLMEHYGQPLPIVKGDMQNKDTVTFLSQALSDCWKRWALIMDRITEQDLRFAEVDMTGFSESQELWNNFCKSEITHLILGQELTHSAKPTGLGSGVADAQSKVRGDIRLYDIVRLGATLRSQLFLPYLRMNGIAGNAPTITWGGIDTELALALSQQLQNLKNAGLEPDDDGLDALKEFFPFGLQRAEPEPQPALNGKSKREPAIRN